MNHEKKLVPLDELLHALGLAGEQGHIECRASSWQLSKEAWETISAFSNPTTPQGTPQGTPQVTSQVTPQVTSNSSSKVTPKTRGELLRLVEQNVAYSVPR